MGSGSRIKTFRKRLKMSQEELARLTGYSDRSSIARLENEEFELSETKLLLMAQALGVTIPDILGYTDPPEVTEQTETFGIVGDIAAGYDLNALEENDDFTGEKIEIPVAWLHGRPKSDYMVLRISGDSMYPDYQDGDLVLILRQITMNHSGQIGAVIYEDSHVTLKRIEYVMGEDWMRLVPINKTYPPITITGEALEHCHVLGPVKMLIRAVRQ